MRLFSVPKPNKKETQDNQARLITAAKQAVQQLTEEEHKALARKETLAKEMEALGKTASETRANLLAEVEALEHRKRLALEPLDAYRLELDQLSLSLDERKAALDRQAAQLDSQADALANKVKQQQQVAENLVHQAEQANAATKLATEKLNSAKIIQQESLERKQTFEEEIKKRAEHITQAERTIAEESRLIELRKEQQDKREKELSTLAKQLQDERLTLNTAWSELRKQQHGTITT